MVLLDDNFATIVRAVREGRRIYDNIRRFIRYAVTTNSAEIWTMFLAPFLGLPIAAAADPDPVDQPGHRRPARPGAGRRAGGARTSCAARRGRRRRACSPAAWGSTSSGSGRSWRRWRSARRPGPSTRARRTGRRWSSPCCASRSSPTCWPSARSASRCSRQGLWSNPPLLGAVALTFVLQLATIYVPALNAVFKTEPLEPAELVIALALRRWCSWRWRSRSGPHGGVTSQP